MKFKCIIPLIITAFFITGCGVQTPVSQPDQEFIQLDQEFIVNNALDQESIMESYRQNQVDTAQRMAQLYIDAIKNGLDLSNDEDAIEMFDLLFDRQTLSVANLQPGDNMPDAYQCDIVGSGPYGDRIVPLYIIFQEDAPRFFCPLPHYGKQSRRSVESYLNYLKAGDAEQLSKWLSIDGDIDYYLDEANRLIEYYKQYNLGKTEIIGFDYDHEKDKFVYRIKDGNEEEFEVLMNFGDGFSMPDIYYILDK